ncbi:hypothetical protein [Rugosimonospora africana]|uniref:Integral membrane protein n=1 Tax=Rugosimonospora africana TaxID=556532 RepID=A0A8J3QPE3_9ACTN|nr:hypothetical protein [Rugosimonospora africana]GIH15000.1 hypothetical protein Raf01_31720 [Rugosimonospora africana]
MTQTDEHPPDTHPQTRRSRWLGSPGDRLVLAVEAGLVGAAVLVGAILNHHGVRIHADAAPIYGRWLPHIGPGTPAAVALAAIVVLRGEAWARRLRWGRLLGAAYLAGLVWTLSLALVDGWSRGLATRLTPQAEYLHDIPKVTSVSAMLHGFSSHILDFQPGSWATHVAGHPPGAFLVFVLLDRIGLGGGVPAALLCVAVGATAPLSVAVTLRALRNEATARLALPFLVLWPGAIWVGASADGLFMGVVAAGLALLAVGSWRPAVAGGLLLGYALYLSYGLVFAGALALVVLAQRTRTRLAAAVAGALGVTVVVTVFTLAGFWWLTGYHLVVQRYYQGWAADRPYGYWVWADLACLLLSAGPVIGPALCRAARRRRDLRSATVWLPLTAAFAVVAADLSGLSKAEVERIWLPYEIWLLAAVAGLPANQRRGWLAVQALIALGLNHLLLTSW